MGLLVPVVGRVTHQVAFGLQQVPSRGERFVDNMAALEGTLGADRFDLLMKDFSTHYGELFMPDIKSWTVKDWLALLGGMYATVKAVSVVCRVWHNIRVHGFSRLTQPDLVKKYGPWAGTNI